MQWILAFTRLIVSEHCMSRVMTFPRSVRMKICMWQGTATLQALNGQLHRQAIFGSAAPGLQRQVAVGACMPMAQPGERGGQGARERRGREGCRMRQGGGKGSEQQRGGEREDQGDDDDGKLPVAHDEPRQR